MNLDYLYSCVSYKKKLVLLFPSKLVCFKFFVSFLTSRNNSSKSGDLETDAAQADRPRLF